MIYVPDRLLKPVKIVLAFEHAEGDKLNAFELFFGKPKVIASGGRIEILHHRGRIALEPAHDGRPGMKHRAAVEPQSKIRAMRVSSRPRMSCCR